MIVTYHIYTHPEAALCLDILVFNSILGQIPDLDMSVVRSSSETLTIVRQYYRPYLLHLRMLFESY